MHSKLGINPDNVLNLLKGQAFHEFPDNVVDRNRHFARLYYYTTKGWIERAKSCRDPEFLHLVVTHFYDLYDQYVLEPDKSRSTNTVHHWGVYRSIVGDSKVGPITLPKSIAVPFAVRAHIRYDLAEAICSACHEYRDTHGCDPDLECFRDFIFGKKSSAIFRKACLDFFCALSPSIARSSALKTVFYLQSFLWMPAFQKSRRQAWREAQQSLMSGKPIKRAFRYSEESTQDTLLRQAGSLIT